MFVLDTNVISELMRPTPHPGVFRWIAAQPRSLLCTTTLTCAEILAGIAILPDGQRRSALHAAATAMFDEDFRGRILAFDAPAADHYADIILRRRHAGLATQGFDALIAATARAAGGTMVTRDESGFAACGLTLINPWTLAA